MSYGEKCGESNERSSCCLMISAGPVRVEEFFKKP